MDHRHPPPPPRCLAHVRRQLLDPEARGRHGCAAEPDRRGCPHAPVVYLSNGPWNLAGAITSFLERHDFPPGAVLLTDWGISPSAWFRDGRAHKRVSLERLAEELPGVRWYLIGDDGEHDPEIYRDFAESHPGQVTAIALRTVAPIGTEPPTTEERVGTIPVVRAGDGRALAERLDGMGALSNR